MRTETYGFPATSLQFAARTLFVALMSTALMSTAAANATVAAIAMHAQQQKASAASPATSPQTCAPAGYVVTRTTGYENGGAVLKNGELQYCVLKDKSAWVRQQCKGYLPADEFVREESGRQDAVYSGMALQGNPVDNIVLFYCLPKH